MSAKPNFTIFSRLSYAKIRKFPLRRNLQVRYYWFWWYVQLLHLCGLPFWLDWIILVFWIHILRNQFSKAKIRRGILPKKTGRILGGFRLSCWLFFGCVFFLCKKHLYIFLSFHQLLHLILCLPVVWVCFFLLFQKFSVFDAQVLSLWQLFQCRT